MATNEQIFTEQQQRQQGTERKPSLGESFMDWVRHNHAQQPSLGSELRAMAREAIKDIRSTVHETYFGKPEHLGEPGAPLNPTQQVITADMGNFRGYEAALEESARSQHQDDDRGMTH
jgi:hypothetical protein